MNSDIVLIEQYRFGQHQRLMELPAGAVEQSEIDEGTQIKVLPLNDFRKIVRSGMLTETAAAFMALDYLHLLQD